MEELRGKGWREGPQGNVQTDQWAPDSGPSAGPSALGLIVGNTDVSEWPASAWFWQKDCVDLEHFTWPGCWDFSVTSQPPTNVINSETGLSRGRI